MDFIPYQAEFGLEVVKLWRQSFQRAMGLEEQNLLSDLRGQLDFFTSIPHEHIHIAMDEPTSTISGFMVLRPGEVEHLYVHVSFQGRGIGRTLIEMAQTQCPQELGLYTFAQNKRAQAFYEAHGFKEVARGFAQADDNPWSTDPEQLADIRYHWSP